MLFALPLAESTAERYCIDILQHLQSTHFQLNIAGFFTAQPMSIQKGSLTLLHLEENKQQQRAKDFTLDLEPMELATVKIEL